MTLADARIIADAVLWEGYLLYPYRSTSAKNRIRWQFGVLGPPAAASGVAEEPSLQCECLLRSGPVTQVQIRLRFLQLTRRQVLTAEGDGFRPVDRLSWDGGELVTFDEAVDTELAFGPFRLDDLRAGRVLPVRAAGSTELEAVAATDGATIGLVRRTREPLAGRLTLRAQSVSPGVVRLHCTVANTSSATPVDRDGATAVSFLGAHVLLSVEDGGFVSLLEPPPGLESAAADCSQRRCWPVLTGSPGADDVMLASPIILYDYPSIAQESPGALFDSTEIDEILTLRVMTMTEQEKAEARATDPAAAAIIDRCSAMSPETLARLHGALRDPRASTGPDPSDGAGSPPALRDPPPWEGSPTRWNTSDESMAVPTFGTPEAPWWDPGVDASVSPATDTVLIDGIPIGKGAQVRIRPRRRADAQDLFYAGQRARVTAVLADVDGNCHVAVVLTDDPAADLHEWYGRYLYFAPDELEPLTGQPLSDSDPLTRASPAPHPQEDSP